MIREAWSDSLIEAKSGYSSTRDTKWKTNRGYPADDDFLFELFDLRQDLAQKHNLAAAHPERVAELSALLKQIRVQGHSAPRLQSVG